MANLLLQTAIASDDAAKLELALKAAGSADPQLLRQGVLRLAELQRSKPAPQQSGTPPSKLSNAAEGARKLADWLASAQLNDMVIDRAMEALTSEDVFTLEDLILFSQMSRFDQTLTALTAQKIRNALARDGLQAPVPASAPALPESVVTPPCPPELAPLSPCASDGIPDWLNDAAAALEVKKTARSPAMSYAAAAASPLPRTADAGQTRSSEQTGVEHAGTAAQPEVCKFFLKGACNRGDACKFRHPTCGAMQGAGVNALAGLPLDPSDGRSRWGGPAAMHTHSQGLQRSQSPGPAARGQGQSHRSGSPRRRGSPRRGGGGGGGRRSHSPGPRERQSAAEGTGAQLTSDGVAAPPEREGNVTINSFLHEAIKAADDMTGASAYSAGGGVPTRSHSPFRSQSFKRRQQRRAAAERQANAEQQDPNVA